jgi:hypothetical protein
MVSTHLLLEKAKAYRSQKITYQHWIPWQDRRESTVCSGKGCTEEGWPQWIHAKVLSVDVAS